MTQKELKAKIDHLCLDIEVGNIDTKSAMREWKRQLFTVINRYVAEALRTKSVFPITLHCRKYPRRSVARGGWEVFPNDCYC
jgi:hypothetical protein